MIYYIISLLFGGSMKKNKNLKLEELRLKYGYTYQQMADKIGVCKAYYWHIEHNNRRLYYDTAKKIAAIFNLKPDDIFMDNKKESIKKCNIKSKQNKLNVQKIQKTVTKQEKER